ncbi:Von Willebrand factor A domain-containing protein 8 [Aphelenchoides bicaudatus]|nr:Von Willebrand factor A domain-containing protein 8 [Aphelenchoides bicaudatus]
MQANKKRRIDSLGSSNGAFVKIGDVQVPIRTAKRPELVPRGFANPTLINQEIGNLKWMLQKEILKQDIFLNGPPGFLKSSLALAYSALNGRVLIIDGIEKTERNVLPILNNLLENREMQLDDGRFLMDAKKYDKLVEKYGKEGVEKMKLERVSEDFAVIALGLPIPNFKGYPLDPPLRSRFQCVNIGYLPFGISKQLCESLTPNVNRDKLDKLLCLAYGINSQHGKDGLNLTRVPIENLIRAISVWPENYIQKLTPHLHYRAS